MILNFVKIIKYILLVLCITSYISCKNRVYQEKNAFLRSVMGNNIGKILILPDSLMVYSPFDNYIMDSLNISLSKFKIYSHINASCPTCIQDIILWDSINTDFNKYKVPIILICDSKDNFELIKYLHETGKIKSFSYPLFFDMKCDFVNQNRFMKESPEFETVLADRENIILLIGNPIHSRGIKDIYLNEIQKRIEEQ